MGAALGSIHPLAHLGLSGAGDRTNLLAGALGRVNRAGSTRAAGTHLIALTHRAHRWAASLTLGQCCACQEQYCSQG
ncbi:MAG: hypothetical protein M1438_15330 [Deltaproteobacteria bacterium]|nr:hypothetical protein [Deltaproteobacteria bacterium]